MLSVRDREDGESLGEDCRQALLRTISKLLSCQRRSLSMSDSELKFQKAWEGSDRLVKRQTLNVRVKALALGQKNFISIGVEANLLCVQPSQPYAVGSGEVPQWVVWLCGEVCRKNDVRGGLWEFRTAPQVAKSNNFCKSEFEIENTIAGLSNGKIAIMLVPR